MVNTVRDDNQPGDAFILPKYSSSISHHLHATHSPTCRGTHVHIKIPVGEDTCASAANAMSAASISNLTSVSLSVNYHLMLVTSLHSFMS